MIWLFTLAALIGSVCAVIDFFVEEYADGYENIMRPARKFLMGTNEKLNFFLLLLLIIGTYVDLCLFFELISPRFIHG